MFLCHGEVVEQDECGVAVVGVIDIEKYSMQEMVLVKAHHA